MWLHEWVIQKPIGVYPPHSVCIRLHVYLSYVFYLVLLVFANDLFAFITSNQQKKRSRQGKKRVRCFFFVYVFFSALWFCKMVVTFYSLFRIWIAIKECKPIRFVFILSAFAGVGLCDLKEEIQTVVFFLFLDGNSVWMWKELTHSQCKNVCACVCVSARSSSSLPTYGFVNTEFWQCNLILSLNHAIQSIAMARALKIT